MADDGDVRSGREVVVLADPGPDPSAAGVVDLWPWRTPAPPAPPPVVVGLSLRPSGQSVMRRPSSAALLGDGQEVALPAGVEELLVNVVTDGFALYRCGPKEAPRALVACYPWEHYVDLLTVGDFARVVTARVPTAGLPVDIFTPQLVVWAYEGPPQHAVRALLELTVPGSYTPLPWATGSVAECGVGMVGCRGGWGNRRRFIAGSLGRGMRIRRGWIVRSGCAGRSPSGWGW